MRNSLHFLRVATAVIGLGVSVSSLSQVNVPKIPPPGITLPEADKAELLSSIDALGKEIESVRSALKSRPALLELLPDVVIFHNAARYAVTYNEFFKPQEIGSAKNLLKLGMERAAALKEGRAPWTTQTGLVVRGYLSKIDGSVQPYGLVVPATYNPSTAVRHRLDIWYHGRGEQLSEVNFLSDRLRNPGEFTPKDAFVVHPYGRYCNANKMAGEVDTFEALAHIKKNYPIDPNRIVVRGFSMGGAACWQYATHFAGEWAAAAPGAGFSESQDFLKIRTNEKVQPTWFEERLWRLYDATEYAVNLFHCPTVAYSGEVDGQMQAARMMEAAMAKEGMPMVHVIGPKTGHSYHPQSKVEINQKIDAIVEIGRNPVPNRVRFTTFTLRYNKMLWIQLDGLEKHWERARVDADIDGPSTVRIVTRNVSSFHIVMTPGQCPLDNTKKPTVVLDGQKLEGPTPGSDRSWTVVFRKASKKWSVIATPDPSELAKRPGLQGPVDDAFFDSFVMVEPTGTAVNPAVGEWVSAEMAHAITHWRQQFRGEARVKKDSEISDADIAAHNLVLWGDPSSNKVLARIADKLPIKWTAAGVVVGKTSYDGAVHAPIMVYPNPLNPTKYVVLNSGFTFREYDYLNNARQIPKLPDYAIIDLRVKPNERFPGKIVDAGFFDEKWMLQPNGGK